MGLGLRMGAPLKAGLFGFVRDTGQRTIARIAEEALAFARSHSIDAVFSTCTDTDGLRLDFRPGNEGALVTTENGYVVFSARTSDAGPGYHAFVVSFLDNLVEKLKLDWDTDNEALGFGDETGFYHHRDFVRLREAMAEQFNTMRRLVTDMSKQGMTQFGLTVPAGFALEEAYFAASPMGFWSADAFETLSPERFYSWWDEGVTGPVLRNMALCRLWMDVPWRPAQTPEERKLLEGTRALASLAAARGAPLGDDASLADLDLLIAGHTLADPANLDRIGFHRRLMRWTVATGWTITMPGYCATNWNRQTGAFSLAYCSRRHTEPETPLIDDRATHVTIYTTKPTDVLEWPNLPPSDEKFRFETEDYRAIATYTEGQDNGETCYSLRGIYRTKRGAAAVTAVFRNQDDIAWAEGVLRSVRYRSPEINS